MTQNLSVRVKLLILSILPFLAFLFFATYNVVSDVSELNKLSKLQYEIKKAELISKVVHESQRERGLSIGFLVSNGAKNGDKLSPQRANVNKTIDELKQYDRDSKVVKAFAELQLKRSQIDSFSLKPADVGSYYTSIISQGLDEISALVLLAKDSEIKNMLLNQTYLLWSKEYMAQMRARLNAIFMANKFENDDFLKYASIRNSYERNTKRFTSDATPNIKTLFENKVTNSKEMADTRSMIETAGQKYKDGNFGIDPSVWFETSTSVINLLKEVEDANMNSIEQSIDDSVSKIKMVTIATVATTILIGVLIGYLSFVFTNQITNSLSKMQLGFNSFFAFLSHETANAKLIDINGQDEFGQMAKIVNENIIRIEKDSNMDDAFIEDVKNLASEMKQGHFLAKVQKDAANPGLKELKNIFNDVQDTIEHKVARDLNLIFKVLDSYGKYDFTARIPNAYGQVAVALNKLGDEISDMLSTSLQNGTVLLEHSMELAKAVEELSSASNEQAASLEQTAAAMEEITSNVESNTTKSTQMSIIAKSAGDSTKQGIRLANDTQNAMNEIQNATSDINQAVNVIENIAFQTNILSLNAAVEAATAGEAGKGFAVVAQEVRNLANRSAEAAKTIKRLAEQAYDKSNEGMEIAMKMNEGFVVIAQKIDETVLMVDDVSTASREQMTGIAQVNDAVTGLDRMTQANAQIASDTSHIAERVSFMADELVKDANKKEFAGKVKMIGT